jgi:hypothetical protein
VEEEAEAPPAAPLRTYAEPPARSRPAPPTQAPISAARQAILDDIEGERRLQARLTRKLKGRTVRQRVAAAAARGR